MSIRKINCCALAVLLLAACLMSFALAEGSDIVPQSRFIKAPFRYAVDDTGI